MPQVMPQAKFIHGSTMTHVVVMSLSGAVGITALFLVDILDLFFLSLLGERYLAAAVGYASTITFITTSIGIGLSIAAGALASKAIGQRRRDRAGQYMVNVCALTLVICMVIATAIWFLVPNLLSLLGAHGQVHELAARFLTIMVPSMPVVALSMCMNAGLKALGDAKLSMSSALAGGAVNAILDPIFIFLFCWDIEGAAIASVLARMTIFGVSAYGLLYKHKMFSSFSFLRFRNDLRAIMSIAFPAIVTNLAMPVSSAWIISYLAHFGDGYVAGYAVIGRITPVAFGVIFALSGAIGPIVGQNYGAKMMSRVKQSLLDALLFTVAYVLIISMVLLVSQDVIVRVFNLGAQGAELVHFFCTYVAGTFTFTGMMFVMNASFNNLGKPFYSTMLNWGRAIIGTLPFVWFGAKWMGATGVLLGQAVGGILFAMISVSCGFWFLARITKQMQAEEVIAAAASDVALPCTMNTMSSECSLVAQMAEEAELDELRNV